MAQQLPPLPTPFEMFNAGQGGGMGPSANTLGQKQDYFDAERSTDQLEGLTDAQKAALMAQRYQAAQLTRQAADAEAQAKEQEARRQAAQADVLKMALDVRKNPGLSDAEKQTAIEAGMSEITQRYGVPGQEIPSSAEEAPAPTDAPPPMLARPSPEEEQKPSAGSGGQYPKYGDSSNLRRADAESRALLGKSENEITNATNDRVKAEKDAMAQEEANAKRESAYYRAQEAELVKDGFAKAKAEERRAGEIDKQMSKYQDLADEIADSEILPWSESKSLGQRIAIGIGVGLMNYGGALANGNAAAGMPTLHALMENDLEAQKAELGKKRSALDARGNLLQMTRDQFGDERSAEAAFRALRLEQAEVQLKSILATNKSEGAQKNGGVLMAQIQQEKAQQIATLRDRTADRLSNSATKQDQLAAEMQLAALKAQEPGEDLSIDGLTGRAISKEAHVKVAEFKAHADTLEGSINELRKLHGRFGRELFRSEGAQQATSLALDIQLALKSTNQLGTLDAGATEFLDKMIASDPTAVNNANFGAKLDQLQKNGTRRADNYYKSMMRGYRSIKTNETQY